MLALSSIFECHESESVKDKESKEKGRKKKKRRKRRPSQSASCKHHCQLSTSLVPSRCFYKGKSDLVLMFCQKGLAVDHSPIRNEAIPHLRSGGALDSSKIAVLSPYKGTSKVKRRAPTTAVDDGSEKGSGE